MDVPIRQVQTAWGTFYATTVDGGTVRFRTRSPNEQDPEHRLTLNRLWYSADVELSMDRPRRLGRHYVDDIWHADPDDCSHRLRRYPVSGEATLKADMILSERVLPELAAWLHTPEGHALIEEGSGYRRAGRVDQATAAEQVLKSALGRVVRIHALLDAGLGIDAKDQELLHHVNGDLSRVAQRGEPQSAATSPAAPQADRPIRGPEPPGL
jgi:hypothetical protein